MNKKNINEFNITTANYYDKAGILLRNFWRYKNKELKLDLVDGSITSYVNDNEEYRHTILKHNEEKNEITLSVWFYRKWKSNYINDDLYGRVIKKFKIDESKFISCNYQKMLNEFGIKVIELETSLLFVIY